MKKEVEGAVRKGGQWPVSLVRTCLARQQIGQMARGGLMVRNLDSYAYACGFESRLRLGHGAYGTFGKFPHPVVLCPVSPMSEDACAWC